MAVTRKLDLLHTRTRLGVILSFCLASISWGTGAATSPEVARVPEKLPLQKRWLFVWRNMSDPKEVERMIQRFPRAAADGYNGVAFSHNIAPEKALELKAAASRNKLDLIAIVMGNTRDRNYVEGVLASNVLFEARNGLATFKQDNPIRVLNGDFEQVSGNHFGGWTMQDDEGLTTFADHGVVHGGKTSLRMENVGRNQYRHSRLSQPLKLQAHQQYLISFWVKTEGLEPADAEVKVLTSDSSRPISFQTFRAKSTQEWKRYDLVFNSLDNEEARLYIGSWSGKIGKLWWDDLKIEEVGLVNVLRRPGCPVTVCAEDGTIFEEGRDYQRIVDPLLNPWHAYHEPPSIKLLADGRIREGAKLRVSYYHPIIVYEDRITSCLSEPKIFETWQAEVKQANDLFHPAAFMMSHDELRVMNQCAACQAMHMSPGELLAWNVKRAAKIIRDVRPDAEIWVWNDMFDPMHNAVDHYYAVKGSLAGSWKGLDKDVGIVNWHGGLKGKNCKFFSDLGLRQILSGYYDSDENGAAISEWLANTKEIPGIVGAMYTTWEDKYGAMDAWASKAWGPPR